MKYFQLFSLMSFSILLSCDCHQKEQNPSDLPASYAKAIRDAIKMEPGEFYDGIRTLSGDSAILATWISGDYLQEYKDKWSSGKPITIKGFDMWVTVVPDLKSFCLDNEFNHVDSASVRLKQLLGLPASNSNQYFVEIKADTDHVYRATPDPAVNTVGVFLPDDSVKGSKPYQKWYKNTLAGSYEGQNKAPWTRLGYTYDWGNPYSEIGLSEFVIPGKMDSASFNVKIVGIYSTEQYCVLTRKNSE